ncbi:hypothetical protein Fot_06915 [Forsythia ovata]|uniref:Uncharacterized protein n=1 Tax=Forsythia ovata TaxID=205694 RepID=A0ABD1WUM4_9LAMI
MGPKPTFHHRGRYGDHLPDEVEYEEFVPQLDDYIPGQNADLNSYQLIGYKARREIVENKLRLLIKNGSIYNMPKVSIEWTQLLSHVSLIPTVINRQVQKDTSLIQTDKYLEAMKINNLKWSLACVFFFLMAQGGVCKFFESKNVDP